MAAKWQPWKVNPALGREYLTPIGDLIWTVQREVSLHMQPDKGDNDWVAGCTAYSRRCSALEKMAAGPDRTWLWAGFIEKQFYIKVLGFPIRIYRAPEVGEIPDKYGDPAQTELWLLRDLLALPQTVRPPFSYRIEVVAKKLARPFRVALVEIDADGAVGNTYTIPRSAASLVRPVQVATDASIRSLSRRKPPVVPPPTEVPSTLPAAEEQREEGTA